MASSTVITQPMLDVAGITGAVGVMLLGLTVAAAADALLDMVQLAIGVARLNGKGMVSYSLQGQSVTTSMADADALVLFLKRMKSTGGGGPISIPVSFA
jgi:hypothetical protein